MVEIRLAAGEHSAPLMLDEADAHTRWVGDTGAVVSGGAAVGGWVAATTPAGALAAPIPPALKGRPMPRQLYVAGVRARETITNASMVGLTAADGAVLTSKGITTPSKV